MTAQRDEIRIENRKSYHLMFSFIFCYKFLICITYFCGSIRWDNCRVSSRNNFPISILFENIVTVLFQLI